MSLEVTDENISDILTNSDSNITILDFWAVWCGPCRIIGPIIDELADENLDINIGKVNVDSDPDIAKAYAIRSIPTIIFFKDGEEIHKITGLQSKATIQDKINELK